MEESIFTGYCRCLDQSRMVTVETAPGQSPEIDCAYFTCIHRAQCPVASQISGFLEDLPLYSQ